MKKVRYVAATLILLLVAGLYLQGNIFAQEKVSVEDKIIGSTFKSLAKAYVATADMEKLKKENIAKINKMDEEKFNRRYAKVYNAVKDLPENLKKEYKITEDKSREQAIKDIQSLDKKQIYKALDAVPDTIIANNFKRYLNEKKEELQKTNLAQQINKVWDKITQKAKKD